MTKQSDQKQLNETVYSVAAVEQFSDTLTDLELSAVDTLVMHFNSGTLDKDTLIAQVAQIAAYRRMQTKLETRMNKQIARTERELGGK